MEVFYFLRSFVGNDLAFLVGMSELNPRKILVVDDEPLFVSSIVESLIRANYEFVESAKDGQEALEKVERTQFDLIITDLNMPEMGGIEFLTALAAIPYRGPIFVLSAFLNPQTERVVRELGATAFIDKPIDIKDFVRLVDESLTRPNSVIEGLTIGLSQTLEQEAKTCLLRVFSRGHQGDLAFFKGKLIDAVTEKEQGDQAAMDIFTWDATKVEIHKATEERHHRITQPMTNLVLAALAIEDKVKESPKESRAPIAQKEVIKKSQVNKNIVKEHIMSNLKKSLVELMQVDGAIAASLVDVESGMPLGMIGGGDHFNIEVASAGNTEVVKSKLAVMRNLKLGSAIEDILITLGTQFHLIRPMTKTKTLFLYFVLDRKKANLALARHKLSDIEEELEI